MRILFLSDNFPPETNAPAIRTYQHAREWVREGHEVTVVTCAPNFPTGRVHDGYRNRPYAVEETDGIRVVRVWTYVTANKGTVRRSFDYLSFMLSGVPASLWQRRPDVVVGTSPQLFAALGAWIVGSIRRVPSVFELRDLWPESIAAVGAGGRGLPYRLLGRLADFLYRNVDKIICVTESFVRVLESRGIPAEKMAVVLNGVDPDEFRPEEPDSAVRLELGVGADEFLATYAGTVGLAHSLTTVLDAADMTRADGIRYLIVGDGAERERLLAEVERRGLSNVTILPGQPRGRVPKILAASDAIIVHLRDDPLFETVIPSKIFEAMAVAKPIILGVRGESAAIVERIGCGVTVAPERPHELASAARRLKADPSARLVMGKQGRRAAESEFSRRAAAQKMLAVLLETAGEAGERTRAA